MGQGVSNEEDTSNEEKKYPMKNDGRGLILIIKNPNHPNPAKILSGYVKDAEDIKTTMREINKDSEIISEENLSKKKFEEVLRRESQRDVSGFDYFACFILSHGNQFGITTAEDDGKMSLISMKEIVDIFKPVGDDRKHFNDIPKLFFVQSCQGPSEDRGYISELEKPAFDDNAQLQLPINSHFFIFYSAPPGFVSWVPEDGSRFICCLCSELSKKHEKMELLGIATRVNHALATKEKTPDRKQISMFLSTLIRPFYFKALKH